MAQLPSWFSFRRLSSLEPRQEELPNLSQILVASLAALATGGLYFGVGARLQVISPIILLVALALLTVPVLGWVLVTRRILPYRLGRLFALAQVLLLGAILLLTMFRLVQQLPTYTHGSPLLRDGALLWVFNVFVFAAWYWEIDGGGPVMRMRSRHEATDFMFPQQEGGNRSGWAPGFIDYLFMAFCYSTALSPADSEPLTQRAKLLVMVQAAISLIIIVLLVGRSVNILS